MPTTVRLVSPASRSLAIPKSPISINFDQKRQMRSDRSLNRQGLREGRDGMEGKGDRRSWLDNLAAIRAIAFLSGSARAFGGC